MGVSRTRFEASRRSSCLEDGCLLSNEEDVEALEEKLSLGALSGFREAEDAELRPAGVSTGLCW